jgi:hypothetical protein
MVFVSAVRWFVYNLAPGVCPDCGALLSPALGKTARQLGAMLPLNHPDLDRKSDWLCCEECDYAVALDLIDDRR